MVRTRLVICLAAAVLVGTLAGSARSGVAGPTGLHGFLLRADEPARTAFTRTPAFAWSPVPGALHYEFQLSLSGTFRDNSVVYANLNVPSPVLAPDLTLPWISGNPHSLYARVRAVTPTGATPWSAAYGFDMVPPAPPTPLPSYPGLLRWTPIEGAAAYQVWLLDAKKMEIVTSNVLDEREFYTYHESTSWMGSIRWRIRVLRDDLSPKGRLNSVPAAGYGPWSPTYVSSNGPFQGGQLKLLGTVSDVFSNGAAGSAAHRLMPAFLFSGNTGLSGKPQELFRVEVFTDKQCLNRVFTGAVTGAPAYAGRPFGPLSLPTSAAGVATARNSFLADGSEPAGVTIDGDSLMTTELSADAAPTGSAPDAPGASTAGSDSTGSSNSSGGSSGSGGSAGAPASTGGTLSVSGRTGAPVDLWDVDWPNSGYYWTVIPVSATPPDAISTALIAPGARTDDTVIKVANANGFNVGDVIQIGNGPSSESRTVADASDGQLTLSAKLSFSHGAGEPVVRMSGSFEYYDLELAQEACASGRVARFGISSEPSLTASGELFATGLSSDGRLISARQTSAFYGQPLVSWTPALGASAYEVQWSKSSYPFTPETKGWVTANTSLVLPVGTGTWYYRVRGFDWNLPSGSQQMSWSDPAKLVVARPTFKVVGVGKAPTSKKVTPTAKKKPATSRRIAGAGFSMVVPTSWKAASGTFHYVDPVTKANVNVVPTTQESRSGAPWSTWAGQLAQEIAAIPTASHVTSQVVTLPAGTAARITATVSNKGKTEFLTEYVFEVGSGALVVAFGADATHYAAVSKTFANEIASLKIG